MTSRVLLLSMIAVTGVGIAGCAPAQPQGGSASGNVEAQQVKHLPQGIVRLPEVPDYVPTPIDASLQQQATVEIATASSSRDPLVRAQALEATSRTQDPAATERVLRGLQDPDWIVRFAAAMCAGDLKLRGAYSSLLAIADDREPSVRVATRYALHQLGDKSLSKELEALSIHPDPKVRSNVAVVLGLLKEPTGTRLLKPMLADADGDVRIQACEALWRLGDDDGRKNLIAGTLSTYQDDQIFCILALAAPRDQKVKDNVIAKLAIDKDQQQSIDLQLAAARAMGMLSSDAGYGVAIQQATRTTSVAGDPAAVTRRRILASFALGEIGRTDAQPALAKLLTERDAYTRLAAAMAIRQIGIKNR